MGLRWHEKFSSARENGTVYLPKYPTNPLHKVQTCWCLAVIVWRTLSLIHSLTQYRTHYLHFSRELTHNVYNNARTTCMSALEETGSRSAMKSVIWSRHRNTQANTANLPKTIGHVMPEMTNIKAHGSVACGKTARPRVITRAEQPWSQCKMTAI